MLKYNGGMKKLVFIFSLLLALKASSASAYDASLIPDADETNGGFCAEVQVLFARGSGGAYGSTDEYRQVIDAS